MAVDGDGGNFLASEVYFCTSEGVGSVFLEFHSSNVDDPRTIHSYQKSNNDNIHNPRGIDARLHASSPKA